MRITGYFWGERQHTGCRKRTSSPAAQGRWFTWSKIVGFWKNTDKQIYTKTLFKKKQILLVTGISHAVKPVINLSPVWMTVCHFLHCGAYMKLYPLPASLGRIKVCVREGGGVVTFVSGAVCFCGGTAACPAFSVRCVWLRQRLCFVLGF